MVLFFPYNTDAPIYYFPYATISLIVFNTLCFFTLCADVESYGVANMQEQLTNEEAFAQELRERMKVNGVTDQDIPNEGNIEGEGTRSISHSLVLEYGKGLRPWQWLTSMFMHAGIIHLIGNMIFLWAFGLVIEGKVGPWKFIAIYLLAGVVESAIEQVLMLGSSGGMSLGASSAIFAMLAVVVVWAPSNMFETFLLLFFRPVLFEVPIAMFGFFFVASNFAIWSLTGHRWTGELLHLIGFAIGFIVGWQMLVRNWVDCEGYDLISYMKGKSGKDPRIEEAEDKRILQQLKAESSGAPTLRKATVENLSVFQNQVASAIAEGQFDLAVKIQRKITATNAGANWRSTDLRQLIQAFIKQKEYAKAEPLMQEHIEQFDEHRFALQIQLVKIWLHNERPRHALRYLDQFNPAFMSSAESAQISSLERIAKKLIQNGAIELS